MTGSSTPTRSCLKRRLQSAKNSISGSLSSGSSTTGSNSSRNSLCKTVSFDGKDNVFFCDPDYDRHSVPVAAKLSYDDILELKMLNINMMCPQHRCAPVVPVGIMPLLPTSDSPPHSASSTSNANSSSALYRPKQVPSPVHHHHGRHNFVSLLDDESSSMSSITPPPSSPSEYSPNMAPMPIIATDDEGQLIFSFSSPDDGIIDSQANTHSLHFATSSRRHNLLSSSSSGSSADESEEENGEHVKSGVPHAVALSKKLSTIAEKAVEPPFPVPPSQPTLSHNHAALTLTPSFFTLPPPASPSSSSSNSPNSATDSSSPFPFAPPVPTTTGLCIQPAAAMTMTLSDSLSGQNAKQSGQQEEVMSDGSVHATTTSPISQALNHHRSTSSSASTIVPTNNNSSNTQSPTSPSSSSTPHASPTLLMRSSRPTSAATPSPHQQPPGQAPPVAGPLAALQNHPRSPQLSGLPSPSLIPPSPLSLYPPSLDLNNNNNITPGVVPNGFFPEKKKGIAGNAVLGHVKRASGSALARPTSPIVKPLAS